MQGIGKGRYTNSHTCIGFLMNNRTLKESNLVEKGAITGEARGRAAYVRFKVRGGDFAFLGAYFPPKPSVKSEHSKYLKTCELVANYLAEVIGKLPNGCTPLISVDLNDGIGRVKRGNKYVYNDTSVINEYASRMEKFEDGAGAMFRRVCESKGLVVHTANHDDRNTWFSGDGKASSLIDYIAGPALLPIRKAGQLSRMGSILQPVDVNREVDHKPTFTCFYTGTDKSKVTPPPKQEWNQNLMMEELKTGKLRPQFVQAVETRLQTLHEDHPTLLSQHTPDDFAETLNSILVEEGQKLFKKQANGMSQEYEDFKQQKHALLQTRSSLKQDILNIPEGGEVTAQLEKVQQELTKVSKQLATLRKSHWHHMQLRLNDEIHEAWGKRDMKSAYKLMRQLAGSKFDIKKRDWRLIRQALPTRKEWEDLLKEEGCKGGMLAKTCTWKDMREEHVTVASETPLPPRDMNQIQQARQDVKKLAQYVIFCKKRKAVPQDSLPVELLVALLAPNYIQSHTRSALHSKSDPPPSKTRSTDYSKPIHFVSGPAFPAREGRPDFHHSAYKPPKLTNPYTRNTFAQLHEHIYRTGCTPLVWHRSQGVAIGKFNGKKGAQGSRLVHVLDPIGKAFFTKKHKMTTLTDNDTGFAANRRRELAILCQNCTNFKLTRARRNFVNNNHDCTNAFCCTGHEDCDKICESHLFEGTEDIHLGKQRHQWASCQVQAREDYHDPTNPLFIRPQQGNLQGDTQAVKTFPIAFNEPVSLWIFQHMDIYATLSNGTIEDYEFCHATCPQTSRCVDTAHTRYADDVVKTIIGPVPDYSAHPADAENQALAGLTRRAEASSLLFSKFLGEKGYAQNTDKLIGVIGLNGAGAHKNLRRLQKEHFFSYKITDHTKSLGSIVNAKGSFQHERTARLDAIAKSRFQLGKRITLRSIPWKLKRTLLIGQVLNVALSGTEAYALQQGDYEALQTAVTKILRKAMGKKLSRWNGVTQRERWKLCNRYQTSVCSDIGKSARFAQNWL